jgi:AraC-like DNA-binding protein
MLATHKLSRGSLSASRTAGHSGCWVTAASNVSDIDQIRHAVSSSIEPHSVRRLGKDGGLSASNAYASLGRLRLVQLGYGADMEVEREVDRRENGVLVEMVESGCSETQCGRDEVTSTSSLATVLTPHLRTRIRYSADCRKLVLRIDAEQLHQHCQSLAGHALRAPLTFRPGLDLTTVSGTEWICLIKWMSEALSRNGPLASSRVAAGQFEQLVMTTLLLSQPHSASDALRNDVTGATPYYVRRAEAYIERHLQDPISIAELARHAGVSARSLQIGFQQHRGVSPTAFIRERRLERVREVLRAADPLAVRITDVALEWGFVHLGKFATVYRRRFGEAPSTTLRTG